MEREKRQELIDKFSDFFEDVTYPDALTLLECATASVFRMASENDVCSKERIQSAFEIFKENIQKAIDKL